MISPGPDGGSDTTRVLILHSRYLSGPASGENRVVDDESRLLAEAGHQVEVWDPALTSTGSVRMIKAGIDSVWSRSAVDRINDMIRSHRPDVVHLHNLFPMLSPAAIRAANANGCRVVVTLHNYRLICMQGTLLRDGRICEDCVGRSPLPGVIHSCYRDSAAGSVAIGTSIGLHRKLRTFDSVTRFLSISDFVKAKHVQAGFPAESIYVKPHFAWPAPRRQGPGDYFLYVGRLSEEKGPQTLIRAWSRFPGRLVVVGDGPEGAMLRQDAPQGVSFTGALAAEDVPAVVAGARAVMIPSLCYEGAGKVVLEAYASGVPVIASRIGGLPEVIEEGETGYLVEPEDVEGWVSAASRLLDDSLCERMGELALSAWQRDFSPTQGLRNLELAYQDALAGSVA
jgi:glycosyltransferase involved in cell wall biosynthesis